MNKQNKPMTSMDRLKFGVRMEHIINELADLATEYPGNPILLIGAPRRKDNIDNKGFCFIAGPEELSSLMMNCIDQASSVQTAVEEAYVNWLYSIDKDSAATMIKLMDDLRPEIETRYHIAHLPKDDSE